MKTDLKQYMEERDRLKTLGTKPGPVVTISRQYGCEAKKVTTKLLSKLAKIYGESIADTTWRFIDKEALEEASVELGLPIYEIDHRMAAEHSAIQDLFASFNNQYTISDEKISESIHNILETYINKGHQVIIGRGAAHLTTDIPDAINVSLFAPIEHRAKIIAQSRHLSEAEAMELIEEVDRNRMNWRENFTGEKFDVGIYDATLNTQRMTVDQIVEVIITLMREKGMLPEID